MRYLEFSIVARGWESSLHFDVDLALTLPEACRFLEEAGGVEAQPGTVPLFIPFHAIEQINAVGEPV